MEKINNSVSPSSIGIPWEFSIDSINNRVRLSMSTEVIDNEKKLKDILDKSNYYRVMDWIDFPTSRITLRFLSKKWYIDRNLLDKLWYKSIEIESVNNLSWRYDWYSLIYLWSNNPNRLSNYNKEIWEYQNWIIDKINNVIPLPYSESVSIFEQKNPLFNTEILSDPTQKDILEIVDLYKWSYFNPKTKNVEYPFELNEKNVSEMLSSPMNIIWVVRNNVDKIISIWIWEVMESSISIDWQKSDFNIMELSDTATLVSYNDDGEIIENLWWKWFNKRLIMEIVKSWLIKYWDDLDLVFWEVRAALDSVNFLAKKTWRNFTGVLSNSVIINWLLSGKMDSTLKNAIRNHNYWDLNIMSMNNDEIKKIYSN